jgi:membrane protein DedA with SNARE-associated domain
MEELLAFIRAHAYLGIFVATLVDATGVPFPGRILLVTAGALAATATDVSVTGLVLAGALGALVGDHAWYLAGRLGGERLLGLYCRVSSRRRRCIDRARDLLARFGGLAFVLGRFFAGVRILSAPVAATGGFGYLRFLVFDLAGALVWSATFVLLGYVVSAQAPGLIERLGVPGAIAIALGVTAAGAAIVLVVRRFSRSARARPRPARDRRRPPAA